MIEDALGLVGTVVADKYEVLEAVGQGGFAVVYRARHALWKRMVALKVFNLGDGSGPGQRALMDDLVREASLLAELSEKTASICQARDVGMMEMSSGQSLPYMVLEWLSGKTLSQTLAEEQAAKTPPRTLAEVVALLEPVAEGLAVAHVSGIAHRDVKPANIFLATDAPRGTAAVKLLDFGIAKVVQNAQKFQKTAGVVTAFTPSHGAPEQFSRSYGATGPWTDVFAFALVIVECVLGRRVVESADIVQIAAVMIDPARRPTPRTLGATVSDATDAVFVRALAVSPRDRYPTVGTFWVELNRSLDLSPARSIAAFAVAQLELAAPPVQPASEEPSTAQARDAPGIATLLSGAPSPLIGLQEIVRPATPKTTAPRRSGKLVVSVFVSLIVLVTVGLAAGYRYVRGGAVLPGPLPSSSRSP